MSGGLRDLASWALRGGAGGAGDHPPDDNDSNSNNSNNNEDAGQTLDSQHDAQEPPVPMTAAELRAQRLQRMEELQRKQQQQEQQAASNMQGVEPTSTAAAAATTTAEPMDIDDHGPTGGAAAAAAAASPKTKDSSNSNSMQIDEPDTKKSITTQQPQQSSKRSRLKMLTSKSESSAASSSSSPGDPEAKRLQRKKELLLKKVLGIVLVTDNSNKNNNNTNNDTSITPIEMASSEISPSTIAEILAARLSLEPPTTAATGGGAGAAPAALLVVPYAGSCYYKAREELKTMSQSSSSKTTSTSSSSSNQALTSLLQEIQTQLVSYTATCLQEPDLFPAMAANAPVQLADCLLHPETTVNITLGGSDTSFYAQLLTELHTQTSSSDTAALQTVTAAAVEYLLQQLKLCESVVDSGNGVAVVAALARLCSHKTVAAAVVKLPSFLLPPPSSPEAAVTIRPPLPTGAHALQRLLASSQNGGADPYRPYTKRSGPGLEKHTLLGQCLRLGAPVGSSNTAFPPDSVLRQSVATVDAATKTQRQQLQHYQAACHQLCKNLLVGAGTGARDAVLQWFTDALLVNTGAAALRPDASKVSGRNLRLNVSVLLLKLCEPVALLPAAGDTNNNPDNKQFAKQHLVDAGFVSANADEGGLFPRTGDDAVARLGGSGTDNSSDDTNMSDSNDSNDNNNAVLPPYNPKNSFIPHIFFCCARSLHFGMVPLLDQHENLLRNISHFHYQIQNSGGDPRTEPRFAALIARQRTDEVALFQEEMVENTLRFGNFTAKVLLDMDDTMLRTMPEDFVSDICSILLGCAVQCPKQLGGIDFRYVFKLVVKLLSPQYASVRCLLHLYFYCIVLF